MRNGHQFSARAEVHSKDVVEAMRTGAHRKVTVLTWRERLRAWIVGLIWRGSK